MRRCAYPTPAASCTISCTRLQCATSKHHIYSLHQPQFLRDDHPRTALQRNSQNFHQRNQTPRCELQLQLLSTCSQMYAQPKTRLNDSQCNKFKPQETRPRTTKIWRRATTKTSPKIPATAFAIRTQHNPRNPRYPKHPDPRTWLFKCSATAKFANSSISKLFVSWTSTSFFPPNIVTDVEFSKQRHTAPLTLQKL